MSLDISRQFHQALSALINRDVEPIFQDETLVFCPVSKDKEAYSLDKKTINKLCVYLSSHSAFLNCSDTLKLQRLQSKLTKQIEKTKERTELETIFAKLIETAKNPKPFISLPHSNLSARICFQKAPIPETNEALLENLQLVNRHFPKYQLGQDLAVYDTRFNSSNPGLVDFDTIQEAHDQYAMQNIMDLSGEIIAEFESLREKLKPVQPVKIAIVLSTSYLLEKDPIFRTGIQAITSGVPLITSQTIFTNPDENKDHLTGNNLFRQELLQLVEKTNKQILFQKKGGLALIISKQTDLSSVGFNPEAFFIPQTMAACSSFALNAAADLEDILLNDQKEIKFQRLVSFIGHGNSEHEDSNGNKVGLIAGLPMDAFQDSLKSLKDKNLVFLYLLSCRAGGKNLKNIRLQDGTIPCPILVSSSTEEVALFIEWQNPFPLLDQAEALLYEAKKESRSIHLDDMAVLATKSQLFYKNPKYFLLNLPLSLMPTSLKDVPAPAYHLGLPDTVLNVHAFLKQQAQDKKTIDSLSFNSDQTAEIFYFLTHTVIDAKISHSHLLCPRLISQGCNHQHIIKELYCPQHSLQEIALTLFNTFTDYDPSSSPSFKTLLLSTFTCQFNGKQATLTNVIITLFPTERSIVFKHEDQYYTLSFHAPAKEMAHFIWTLDSLYPLSEEEAIFRMYKACALSSRNEEEKEQFYEATNRIFWKQQAPLLATFLESILLNRPFFEKNKKPTTLLEKSLEDIKSHTRYQYFISRGWDLAALLQQTDILKKLIERVHPTFANAINFGNLEEISRLIQEKSLSVNSQFIGKNTLLHLAIYYNQPTMIAFLLEQGACQEMRNAKDEPPLVLAVSMQAEASINSLLDSSLVASSLIGEAIECALNLRKPAVIDFLIQTLTRKNSINFLANLYHTYKNTFIGNLLKKALNYSSGSLLDIDLETYKQHLVDKYDSIKNGEILLHEQNIDGNSPLHLAVQAHHLEAVRALLHLQAYPLLFNYDGQTAVDLIDSEELQEIFKTSSPLEAIKNLETAVLESNQGLIEELVSQHGYPLVECVWFSAIDANNETLITHLSKNKSTTFKDISSLQRFFQYAKMRKNSTLDDLLTHLSYGLIEQLIVKGSLEDLRMQLNQPSVNLMERRLNGNTFLHTAVKKDHGAMIELLVKRGASAQIPNDDGHTPFDLAILNNHPESLKILLEYSLPLTPEAEQKSWLIATSLSRVKVIKLLASRKIGARNPLKILSIAISKGNIKMFDYLLSYFSSLRMINKPNLNQLYNYAQINKQTEICTYLLEKTRPVAIEKLLKRQIDLFVNEIELGRADLYDSNLAGNTLLHLAVKINLKEMVQLLVAKGAPLDCVNKKGETALNLAVKKKNFQLVKLLTEGKTLSFKTEYQALRTAIPLKNNTITTYLIDRNRATHDVVNLFHLMIDQKDEQLCIYFMTHILKHLNKKIDINFDCIYAYAKKNNCQLIAKGIYQYTSIVKCLKENNIDQLKSIIENTAVDLQDTDITGNTALHLAVQHQREDASLFLIDHGSPLGKKNMQGKTPLEIAEEKDFKAIIHILSPTVLTTSNC